MANQPPLFKRVRASMNKEDQGTFLDGGDGGKLSTLDSRVNPTRHQDTSGVDLN